MLTISTHHPYEDKYQLNPKNLTDKRFSDETLHFFQKANYADKQLSVFIDKLKEEGIYDNSLIVIMADHNAPLNYESSGISKSIPLIILNSGMKSLPASSETIYQQDLFPSLLELMAVEFPANWRGIGYSIFSDSTERTMSQEAQQRLSDVILETNWFGKLNLTH